MQCSADIASLFLDTHRGFLENSPESKLLPGAETMATNMRRVPRVTHQKRTAAPVDIKVSFKKVTET